jgi:hypothetical protein
LKINFELIRKHGRKDSCYKKFGNVFLLFAVLGTSAGCPIGFGGFCLAPALETRSRSYNDLVYHVAVSLLQENGALKKYGEFLFLSCTLSSLFPAPGSNSSSDIGSYYRSMFVALLSFVRGFLTGWLRIKSRSPPPKLALKMMQNIILQALPPVGPSTEQSQPTSVSSDHSSETRILNMPPPPMPRQPGAEEESEPQLAQAEVSSLSGFSQVSGISGMMDLDEAEGLHLSDLTIENMEVMDHYLHTQADPVPAVVPAAIGDSGESGSGGSGPDAPEAPDTSKAATSEGLDCSDKSNNSNAN